MSSPISLVPGEDPLRVLVPLNHPVYAADTECGADGPWAQLAVAVEIGMERKRMGEGVGMS